MKTYVVGGAVRDQLMGQAPKDVDYVVVGVTHEQMIKAGFKQVGADFPVYLDDKGEEYALARTEKKTGVGYHGFDTRFDPSVTIEEDLFRRDLTINAMARDLDTGELVDPYGGEQDLKNKVLRHVSEAFAEDPLRVLRLARFHARLGPEWTIDNETMCMCQDLVSRGELDHLTSERVFAEMMKALSEPHPDLFFEVLREAGALEKIVPGMEQWSPSYMNYTLNRAQTVKMRFALMLRALTDKVGFTKKYVVPNFLLDYSKMVDARIDNWCDDSDLIDFLYSIDAYRHSDLFEGVAEDMHFELGAASLDHDAFIATWKVGFDQLTPEQQATLKGPEIAAAIKQKRREVWHENQSERHH